LSITLTPGETALPDCLSNLPVSNLHWSVRAADALMERNLPFRWHYEHGLAHKAVEQVWQVTQAPSLYAYFHDALDAFVRPDGSIHTYRLDEYNLDQINPGKLLFPLYRVTHAEKFHLAANLLRRQLTEQPRTSQQGFWHKQIYPFQMWLDGVYMAAPFLAEYGYQFGDPTAFDEATRQILLLEEHARDPRSGLLYHAWDESKQMPWANPNTGCSPNFWGRAMGWYAMAIVDVLDFLPSSHAQRAEIIAIFQRLIEAVGKVQDFSSGLWYQVLDQGERPGNYLEASASCMFVYAIAKAVRQGVLPQSALPAACKGYQGILSHFIRVDAFGRVNVERTCSVGGLGGTPYRDGSYEYYISEKIVTNDYKGVGPFILASLELEQHGK
jgi:unsaturated rhamnogalacturonyl hydrolase